MNLTVAVVAHFDANNSFEDNFLEMLSCLESVVDEIALVTTSNFSNNPLINFKKVTLLQRPNFGYDFYSYKVGIAYFLDKCAPDSMLLLNSSFVVTNRSAFTKLLQNMSGHLSQNDVVGVTESKQFDWHVQSYLLYLSGRILRHQAMSDFFDRVEPLNTKMEVILQYEIGLSRVMKSNEWRSLTIFQPSLTCNLRSASRWTSSIINATGWLSFLNNNPLKILKGLNFTHFASDVIQKKFGFVKTEVLRNNPHQLFLEDIWRNCEPLMRTQIIEQLKRSNQHYQLGKDGLSAFRTPGDATPKLKFLEYGRIAASGVKVAVVIHLFYIDLLNELLIYLLNIVEPFDLYITTPFEGDIRQIINRCSTLPSSVTVCIAENRGRDIGPFVALYRSGRLDKYSHVLKLHSKKSKYSQQGDAWRKKIYFDLIGSSLTVRKTLRLFEKADVGVVGPHTFYLSNERYWGANRQTVEHLLKICGILPNSCGARLGFFAGSMFWFAPVSLAPLKNMAPDQLAFELEDGKQDGTLAHALERAFCPIASSGSFIVTSTVLNGISMDKVQTIQNTVPVL